MSSLTNNLKTQRWAEISQRLSAAYKNLQEATACARSIDEDKVADDFLEVQGQVFVWLNEARMQRRALEQASL